MAKKWMQRAVPESHRGEFTAKAEKAGMGVQAYARSVMAHPEKHDAHTVHQAQFARVAKKVSGRRKAKRRH